MQKCKKIIEFKRANIYKPWRDKLAKIRTEAENKGQKVKSLLAKGLGNQSYGLHLLNVTKRPKTTIIDMEKTQNKGPLY